MFIKKLSEATINASNRLRGLGQKKLDELSSQIGYRYCPPVIFDTIPEKHVNGYYSPSLNMIVLDETLIKIPEYLDNVFLHELAHFVDCVVNGDSSHDGTFKKICLMLGVNEDFVGAKTKKGIDFYLSRQEKIQKLLNLGSSDFTNEAESAILKARDLMEKWNISVNDEEDAIYCAQVSFKRREAWLIHLGSAVGHITGAFPVINRTFYNYYGTREQAEAALYIHDSLVQAVNTRCEKIVQEIKNPPRPAFHSSSEQGTFEEYLYFLATEASRKVNTPRINRGQIRAGIIAGFWDRIKKSDSKEIAIRMKTNENAMRRITKMKLRVMHASTTRSNAYLKGVEAGKTISVSNNGITKRIGTA